MPDARIAAGALCDLLAAIFAAAGNPAAHARAIATHIVASNFAAHKSHGVNHVPL